MAINFDKLRILIVEDTQPMRTLIATALNSLGIKDLILAKDGDDGFEKFSKENPDIVISDWIMEPTDGIELTQKIRKSSLSPNRLVPIILVTGYTAKARVAEARDAGVTEFLVKPFSANDIAKRISYVISMPRDFIDADEYFGPDRRRRENPEYKGPRRREADNG